jgi:hypothetical protein
MCPFYPPSLRKVYGKEVPAENQCPKFTDTPTKKRKSNKRKPKILSKKRKNYRLRVKEMHALSKEKEMDAKVEGLLCESNEMLAKAVRKSIQWYFLTYKGARAKRYGLGELKEEYPDPLFSINHTLAMLRAGMSRLIRRTWNTTKLQKYLQQHLNVYMYYHNCRILFKMRIDINEKHQSWVPV